MHLRSRAAVAAIAAGIIAVISRALLRNFAWGVAARLALSLAPVLVMTLFCLLAVRVIRGFDELETRIHLEGALYGLLGTALLTMAAGLLSKEGLLPPVTLAVAWPWLWTGAFLLWGAGTLIAGARYR